MRSAFLIGTLWLVAAALIGPRTVSASPFFIDEFRIVKNGNADFIDPFNDGVPPPSAPAFVDGTPATYSVNGVLNEAAGRVRLDTAGAIVASFAGLDFLTERALLLTNIDPTNLELGLKSDDTFSVIGRYDLAVPAALLEFYGIRLIDTTASNLIPDDLLQLGVRRGADGIDRVQFFRLDVATQIATFIASAVLEPGHDQILLDLTRASASSDAITASFAYVDGGVVGPVTTFGTTADIFHGENFTRAQFVFFTPAAVPEPSTWLLLGSGLIGLGLSFWRGNYRRR